MLEHILEQVQMRTCVIAELAYASLNQCAPCPANIAVGGFRNVPICSPSSFPAFSGLIPAWVLPIVAPLFLVHTNSP
jgi:hypothetical protein